MPYQILIVFLLVFCVNCMAYQSKQFDFWMQMYAHENISCGYISHLGGKFCVCSGRGGGLTFCVLLERKVVWHLLGCILLKVAVIVWWIWWHFEVSTTRGHSWLNNLWLHYPGGYIPVLLWHHKCHTAKHLLHIFSVSLIFIILLNNV